MDCHDPRDRAAFVLIFTIAFIFPHCDRIHRSKYMEILDVCHAAV